MEDIKVSDNLLLNTYKNGNHTIKIYSNGTKIKETVNPNDGHFTYSFPESFDIHINNRCNAGCPYCHEDSTKDGRVPSLYDMIFAEYTKEPISKTRSKIVGKFTPFYDSIHSGTEMAIGGGNIFETDISELSDFLALNRYKGIISNITVNQKHVKQNFNTLKNWVDKGFVNGIGLSLTDSSDKEFWNYVDQLGNNVVIHVIAGILSEKDIPFLKDRKILVLGYKHLRRGDRYFSTVVEQNINWLKDNLSDIYDSVKLMSFDCLGIEQIDPKSSLAIDDNNWNTIYQGSDTDVRDRDGNITCSTMYIDLCGDTPTCARMSTANLNKRYSFSFDETIETVFERSTQGW